MAAYVRGRGVDTFRMFNTSRAVGTIAASSFPLTSDADVDRLPLGVQLCFLVAFAMAAVRLVDLAAVYICIRS